MCTSAESILLRNVIHHLKHVLTAACETKNYNKSGIFSVFFSVNAVILAVPTSDNVSTDVPTVPTSPWLPMLRMIRVIRILRVARVASGIRTLLFALMLSAPALFNVGSLLLLFMFIYAVFGMSQFNHVEKKGALNDVLNFETFPNAFLLLFQVRF